MNSGTKQLSLHAKQFGWDTNDWFETKTKSSSIEAQNNGIAAQNWFKTLVAWYFVLILIESA